MKKLLCSLMIAASCLVACNNTTTMTSEGAKNGLESKGFTAEIMTQEEAKARISGINFNVTVKDVCYGKKGEDQVFLGFYCNNIDDASAFLKENIQTMYYYGQDYSKDSVTGSYNNVAYVGTKDAISAAGISLSI